MRPFLLLLVSAVPAIMACRGSGPRLDPNQSGICLFGGTVDILNRGPRTDVFLVRSSGNREFLGTAPNGASSFPFPPSTRSFVTARTLRFRNQLTFRHQCT